MKKIFIIVVSAMLFAGLVAGASAFTSAEMTRSANVNVVADDSGVITLAPGTVGDTATLENGELNIDASPNSTGLNVSGVFTFGDSANPTTEHLFTMTNTTAEQQTITMEYVNVTDSQGNTGAVTYTVYDDTGTEVGTFSEGSSLDVTAGSGASHYIVMDVDTNNLDTAADLSGDIKISA